MSNTGHPPTTVVRLDADEASARRISDFLTESYDAEEVACAACAGPNGRWAVEVHFGESLDEARLRDLVALAGGDADALTIEKIEPRDWVKASLEGLKPVHAGRFIVHGSHDREAVSDNQIGIEIDAALAFGTGHHGTTRGCLLMLDAIARHARPRRILDLGTGTAVLAIGASKRWRTPVLATDIDEFSVRTARENARANRVGALVETVQAAGFNAPEITARAPFDLVFANILLSPLQRLAAPMARTLAPNAHVILSGLMLAHANAAISAYRSQGLVLKRAIRLDGWVTLLMTAPGR